MPKGNKWYISDLHLEHQKLLDGTLRPFKDAKALADTIRANWIARVAPEDRVFVLGDLCVGAGYRKAEIIEEFFHTLPGRKTLVLGNHDPKRDIEWFPVFDEVCGTYVYGTRGWVLSHVPVHPSCLEHRWAANIHGHTHGTDIADPRYVNVSVERTGYAPQSLGDVITRLNRQMEMASWQ